MVSTLFYFGMFLLFCFVDVVRACSVWIEKLFAVFENIFCVFTFEMEILHRKLCFGAFCNEIVEYNGVKEGFEGLYCSFDPS